jgi:hypothetical protein
MVKFSLSRRLSLTEDSYKINSAISYESTSYAGSSYKNLEWMVQNLTLYHLRFPFSSQISKKIILRGQSPLLRLEKEVTQLAAVITTPSATKNPVDWIYSICISDFIFETLMTTTLPIQLKGYCWACWET